MSTNKKNFTTNITNYIMGINTDWLVVQIYELFTTAFYTHWFDGRTIHHNVL